ncbi:MAG: tripartite tricarboxylate transporter permease [Rhodospirillales bacterium]|nr:tripartite tricarboxylate transporter permease [Rhodospirillales bacterium]
MELIESLGFGFSIVLGWKPLLIIVIGVTVGIMVGAMPGLSPSTGVALLVPFSYTMSPTLALVLLVSIYIASNYGGSITAVLINTPGTPSAAATAMDGYPLTLKGQAGKGLGMSLIASTIGGIFGVIILIVFAVPLAKLAIAFHPADYFALAIFGLTTVGSLGSGNVAKSMLAVLFGLLINTIGIDPLSGVTRFTWNVDTLYDGFSLIPALIGLFALSVVFAAMEKGEFGKKVVETVSGTFPTLLESWKVKMTITRSSILGTVIGVFPGAGATIASFISYGIARRSSKDPDSFGKGSLDGVAASEAANSSSVGGALIPLLALGIPGSATDAVLIGALQLHDITPGPMLFQTNPEIVYGIFAALIIANGIMLLMGFYGVRIFAKVVEVPISILYPLIIAIALIGSFAVRGSFFDVGACFTFGVIGWILKRYGFPVAPVVLGIVLGSLLEENFRRAIMMDGPTVFFTEPLSATMLAIAALLFILPIYRNFRAKKASSDE